VTLSLLVLRCRKSPLFLDAAHHLEGAEPPARVAAVRALDFDHACPIVGQELGTVGAANVVRQI